MHSLLSPFDKKHQQSKLNMTFSEEEVDILKDKLGKDIRDLQKQNIRILDAIARLEGYMQQSGNTEKCK